MNKDMRATEDIPIDKFTNLAAYSPFAYFKKLRFKLNRALLET